MLKIVVLLRCVVQLNAVCDMRSLPRHLAVSELPLEKIGLSTPKGKAEKNCMKPAFFRSYIVVATK